MTNWQDVVLAAGGFWLAIALLPTIFGSHRPPRKSSLQIVVVLAAYTAVFITFGLWLTVAGLMAQLAAWTAIVFRGPQRTPHSATPEEGSVSESESVYVAGTMYQTRDTYGNVRTAGRYTQGAPIVVDRLAGERLFEWWAFPVGHPDYTDTFVNGRWVERGAYAGPDAHETQPAKKRCRRCGRERRRVQACISHDDSNCLACEQFLHSGLSDRLDANLPESATEKLWSHFKADPRTILQEANEAVYGEREHAYGHPHDDFGRTAILWEAYVRAKYGISVPFVAFDVSKMLRDLKDSRLMKTPLHRDSHVDIAGYAAAGARAVGVDK